MKQILQTALFLLTLAGFAFSQAGGVEKVESGSAQSSTNLLEKINLRFDLEGNPNLSEVGFDDPKSVWKLKYELRLSDEKTVRELQSNLYANCKNDRADYNKCVLKTNRKLDKKYAKTALLISKKEFRRIGLLAATNRETLIPVSFASQVIGIFNKAVDSPDNPIFILRIKSNVSAKTSTNIKVKLKHSARFEYALKLQKKDGSFELYNINSFGASNVVSKENGGFSYGTYKN